MRKLLNIKKMRTMLPSILMILATGWFAACSQDEQAGGLEPGEGDMPISFGGAVDNDKEQVAGSRAGLEEGENGKFTFKLWGYKSMEVSESEPYDYSDLQTVMNGYTITYTAGSANSSVDNTDGWHYVGNGQTLKYWDPNAKAYRFMAFAPYDADQVQAEYENRKIVEVTAPTATDQTLKFDVKVNASTEEKRADVPYISKMWFSNDQYNPAADRPYGEVVRMEFFKPYIRVRFMFIDETGESLKTSTPFVPLVDKTSIRFAPADGVQRVVYRGYVTVTYPLAGTETKETYEYRRYDESQEYDSYEALTIPYETTSVLVENTADLNKWHYLLPNNTQGAFKMSLIVNNATRSAIVPAQFMQWNLGYQYTYVFKISIDDLSFQPELFLYDKWQTGYVDDEVKQW